MQLNIWYCSFRPFWRLSKTDRQTTKKRLKLLTDIFNSIPPDKYISKLFSIQFANYLQSFAKYLWKILILHSSTKYTMKGYTFNFWLDINACGIFLNRIKKIYFNFKKIVEFFFAYVTPGVLKSSPDKYFYPLGPAIWLSNSSIIHTNIYKQ